MAIVGVFDPLLAATGAPLRARLPASLGAEGPVWVQERGALALGCAGAVEHDETLGGTLCLFEGSLYNGEELARRLGLPGGLVAAALVTRDRKSTRLNSSHTVIS